LTRKAVWLTILVAGCCSSAFAQHGIKEFTANGTFQVPAGVTTLRVDAYGAGGGGGGGTSMANGGGGGGGAYSAGVVTVSPDAVLTIVIGGGGAGGLGGDTARTGSTGGAAKILDPSQVVIFSANGGKGGLGASGSTQGAGGAGGAIGAFGGIRHVGRNGDSSGGGGAGYLPIGFSLTFILNGKFGTGGQGGPRPFWKGFTGLPGYILISW
jgi:hypothetical protein